MRTNEQTNKMSDCPICFEQIDANTNRVITMCGHEFHCSCLMKNASVNGFNCPYCRTTMVPQAQPPAPVQSAPIQVSSAPAPVPVQQNPEIRESDILRGFRMFNDLVNNEQHNFEDLQQERFYQAFENRSIIQYENVGNEYGVQPTEEADNDNEDQEHDYDEEEPVSADFTRELGQNPEENYTNIWYISSDRKWRYKGEWKHGMPNGRGTKEIFAGNHRNEYGETCDEDGNRVCHSIIECTFINGVVNGYGIQRYDQEIERGETSVPYYRGYFKNGEQHGMGEYHFGDGSYYKGAFKFSKFHGRGIYYNHNTNKTSIGEYINDHKMRYVTVRGQF